MVPVIAGQQNQIEGMAGMIAHQRQIEGIAGGHEGLALVVSRLSEHGGEGGRIVAAYPGL